MQQYKDVLTQSELFEGIDFKNYGALFACIGGKTAGYVKGAFVSLAGDTLREIGVVLAGRVQIVKEDIFGNRAILNDMGPGAVFGEAFICGGGQPSTVTVLAAERAEILFLPFDRVMQTCPSACGFHTALIKNMVVMLARKNQALVQKLEVTTKHSLREKILTYLSQLAQAQDSRTVTAPLGRTDLADFLGADRSALTRELNRMREDGLLVYEKNRYTLL